MSVEKLQQIIDGRIVGTEEADVLREAIERHQFGNDANSKLMEKFSQAEARLINGETGRPGRQSYR